MRLLRPIVEVVKDMANREKPEVVLQIEHLHRHKMRTLEDILKVFDCHPCSRFFHGLSLKASNYYVAAKHEFEAIA